MVSSSAADVLLPSSSLSLAVVVSSSRSSDVVGSVVSASVDLVFLSLLSFLVLVAS